MKVRDYNNDNHTITVELGMYVMANRQGYWSDVDSFGVEEVA